MRNDIFWMGKAMLAMLAFVCALVCHLGTPLSLENMVSRERRKLFFEGLVRHRRTMLNQWRSKYKEILANPQGESFMI